MTSPLLTLTLVSNSHPIGGSGPSFHIGPFAVKTNSFVLEGSLDIKDLLQTCQTLSYEVYRKLKDTKENVTGG